MNKRESEQKASRRGKMKRTEQPLRGTELRLLAELMKNSRRSDRELARVIGVSQPTITRIRMRLEKEDVIKEYTVIPDFRKIGYTIMGATRMTVLNPPNEEELKEIRKSTLKIEEEDPRAALMAVSGLSDKNMNRLFITFYRDYSDYADAMRLARHIPLVDVDSLDTLLVDLNDKTSYRLLSMSSIASHLLKRLKKNETRGNKTSNQSPE